jgi:hypothetical protein
MTNKNQIAYLKEFYPKLQGFFPGVSGRFP